jgi:hypothetical protein
MKFKMVATTGLSLILDLKGKKGFFWSCKGYFDEPKCEFMTQDKAGLGSTPV